MYHAVCRRLAPLFSLALLFAPPLAHAETIGTVHSVEGTIFLHKGGSARYEKLDKPGAAIDTADMVRTSSTSRAVVHLNTGSRLLLDNSSRLTFKSAGEMLAQAGTVLFDISKQGQVSGFKVTSPVATIGIRGTQFAVDVASEDGTNIYMNHGAIEVTSLQKEFKRYRQSIDNEFSQYKKSQEEGLAEYKKRLENEYYEFVTGFTMESDAAVAISGNEVRDVVTPDEIKALMEEFFAARDAAAPVTK